MHTQILHYPLRFHKIAKKYLFYRGLLKDISYHSCWYQIPEGSLSYQLLEVNEQFRCRLDLISEDCINERRAEEAMKKMQVTDVPINIIFVKKLRYYPWKFLDLISI